MREGSNFRSIYFIFEPTNLQKFGFYFEKFYMHPPHILFLYRYDPNTTLQKKEVAGFEIHGLLSMPLYIEELHYQLLLLYNQVQRENIVGVFRIAL